MVLHPKNHIIMAFYISLLDLSKNGLIFWSAKVTGVNVLRGNANPEEGEDTPLDLVESTGSVFIANWDSGGGGGGGGAGKAGEIDTGIALGELPMLLGKLVSSVLLANVILLLGTGVDSSLLTDLSREEIES